MVAVPGYNYAPDAGAGSCNFAGGGGAWRAALLGSVTAGAILAVGPRIAEAGPDACHIAGNVATCQGDQSDGISYNSPAIETLNVNSLTANIAPGAGDGVNLSGTGDITIDADLGTFVIDAPEDGVEAESTDGGVINITTVGDITGSDPDEGQGIKAASTTGDVTVNSTGDVTGGYDGIYVVTDGAITIISEGNVTAYNDDAINAEGGTGDVSITSTGNIVAGTLDGDGNVTGGDDGIDAGATSGNVTVNSTGDITAGDDGIFAETEDGAVTVNNTGDIAAGDEGIEAKSEYGDVTINSTGDIVASDKGIEADSEYTGTISIASTGDITSTNDDAINARSGSGDITIISIGDLVSEDGDGIDALSEGGGNITITSTGNITAQSYGIDAGSKVGGDITIVSTGDIVVEGDYAGIKAATFGAITIESTGDIGSPTVSAYYGVHVEGGSSALVTLRDGKVYGSEYGLYFDGGLSNSLKNYAELSGGTFAVHSTYGETSIENFGLITGDVDLMGGPNVFINRSGGEFRPGGTVDLSDGLLTNEGVLSPGGSDAVQTSVLTGSLVQTADGSFVVDIDESGAGVDKLTISGTADFAGLVVPNIIGLQSTSGQFIIAEATAVTLNGAEVQDQGFFDFDLTTLGDGTQLALTFSARSLTDLVFGPLTGNQRAVVNYLDAVGLSNPTPDQVEMFNNLFDLPDEASLLAALDQLSPEHYLAQAMGTWFASAAFVRGAMSCPEPGAAGALVREGQCYWARVEGRRLDWDRTRDNIGGDETAWSLSAGLQTWLGDGWLGGGALGYERSDIDSDNGASADGDRFHGALTLKRDWQDFSMGVAVFAGYGSFDTDRPLGLAMPGAVASGDQDILLSGAHLRLSHTHSRGAWYLRPMVDLNLTYLSYGDLRETGAGNLGLNIREEDEWLFSASPAIEIGGTVRLGDGTVIQPFARAGVTWLSDDSLALSGGFANGPDGIGPFTVSAEFDNLLADLSAGVVALSDDGFSLRAGYDGRFGEDVEQHSGSVKVGVRF